MFLMLLVFACVTCLPHTCMLACCLNQRKASEQAYNSTTHPTEWHFLNRLVKSKKGTLDEITKAWEEGQCLHVCVCACVCVSVHEA